MGIRDIQNSQGINKRYTLFDYIWLVQTRSWVHKSLWRFESHAFVARSPAYDGSNIVVTHYGLWFGKVRQPGINTLLSPIAKRLSKYWLPSFLHCHYFEAEVHE